MKYRKIFKAEAQGDAVYINADNEKQAYGILIKKLGDVPRGFIVFTEVDKMPKGEELL